MPLKQYSQVSNVPQRTLLITGMFNEFRENMHTYSDPDVYLEMLFASVASEINTEIEENIEKE